MARRCKRFAFLLIGIIVGAALWAYCPRLIRGHWVRRRIEWYGIAYGVPILYPGVVDFVYHDQSGNLIQHGPYHRYVYVGPEIRVAAEGFFDNGVPDGTFTEWNTQDGSKMDETFYVKGKQVGDAWYQHNKLFQYRMDLYYEGRRIATKIFWNGRWSLEAATECLTFTIDPQSGELRYLDRVVCR
jgi:hypothetical protein